MISRWISDVPSQIRSTRSSRKKRSAGVLAHVAAAAEDLDDAVGAAERGLRLANSFASDALAWTTFGSAPASWRAAASRVSSRAAAASAAESASGNETPWKS